MPIARRRSRSSMLTAAGHRVAGDPELAAPTRQADRARSRRGHRGAERLAARVVRDRRRRLPVRRKHEWIEPWGISWHLGVDGISLFLVVLTGVLFPLAIVGTDPHHDEKPLPRLAAAARGRRDGQLPQPRPVPVLRLLRDRARADVLPHRRLGLRQPRLRGDEVLPVHDVRLGVHARRHHRHRRSSRRTTASARSRSTSSRSPRTPTFAADHRPLAVLRVRHRVRRQGADVPAAHVAARRAHPGADRRLGDPGRRDAEARHVRAAALRHLPVPGGGALGPRRCSSRSP